MQQKLKIAVLLTLAIIANANAVLGQNIFQQRSLLLNKKYVEYNSVFPSDTGFFVLGWGSSIVPIDSITLGETPPRIYSAWYDWHGQSLNLREFYLPNTVTYGMWHSASSINNNSYYHFATIVDSTNNQQDQGDILIKRFALNGDTLWTKRFNSNLSDFGYSCLSTENGGIGIGLVSNGTTMSQRVMRFDSLGNVIWNKIYNTTNRESYAKYIISDGSGNFFISGWTRPFGGSNPKNARTRVMKIDGDGEILWNKPMPGTCDEFGCAIDLAQDGNLLLAKYDCYDEPTSFSIRSKISLFKLNSLNGDTIWHKQFSTQYYNADIAHFVKQLPDSDIILGGAGIYLHIVNNDTLFGRPTGVFIRTDSMGNVKWQRYYFYNLEDGNNMYQNFLTDGKPTPDGGFILVGRTSHFTDFDDGWIIKTDANGCIDAGCINGIEELDDDDFRLFIYPNPAEDNVSIDLPILYNKGTLQVYNMQGQLVKTASITTGGLQIFNISEMPNGIYQLVVYSKSNKLIGREKLVVAR